MTTWTLIILVAIGGLSSDESNAMTSVPGFASKEQCQRAAAAVKSSLSPGRKNAHTVCVEQGGQK